MNTEGTLRITFSPDVLIEDMADVEDFARRYDDELDELKHQAGVSHVILKPGSIGVGASGPGVDVIIHIVDNLRWISDDVARMALWGGIIKCFVDKVRSKQRKSLGPCIEDPDTLGALAATAIPGNEALSKYRFIGSRLLTIEEGLGSDERQLAASTFVNDTAGSAIVVFISPSGALLGMVQVPLEVYWAEGHMVHRSSQDLRDLFHTWNHSR